MSSVLPPTPELPEPDHFSRPHQYEFYGENKIMSLFQTYQRLAPSAANSLKSNAPSIPQRCRLSDKVFLYKALGFQFNDTGDKSPHMKRRGSFVYRSLESKSFLEGILLQKRHFSPIMSRSLMWMSMPFSNLPDVSMYVVDTRDPGLKAVKIKPEQMCSGVDRRREGEVDLNLWSCSRWKALPVPCPLFLHEVLNFLQRRCVISGIITVDVLGETIVDLHSYSCVEGLNFDKAGYVEVSFQFDETRPFYYQSASSIEVKDM